jgi:nicotinamidase-related amidase
MSNVFRWLAVLGLLLVVGGSVAIAAVQDTVCRTALLIIDVQKAWVGNAALTTDDVLIQEKTAEIAASARAAGVPVVFVIDVAYRDQFGDEGLELVEPLEVLDGDLLVEKTALNGFVRTSLKDDLLEMGVTTVLITGYASHECVAQTARGADSKGFEVIIIEDGHSGGAGGDWARKQNLEWRDRGWLVIPSTEIDFAALCLPPDPEAAE